MADIATSGEVCVQKCAPKSVPVCGPGAAVGALSRSLAGRVSDNVFL